MDGKAQAYLDGQMTCCYREILKGHCRIKTSQMHSVDLRAVLEKEKARKTIPGSSSRERELFWNHRLVLSLAVINVSTAAACQRANCRAFLAAHQTADSRAA